MKAVAVAIALLSAVPLAAAAAAPPTAATPQAAIDALFAADRAFAAAGAELEPAAALSAMFDEAVVMPLPTGGFARGKAAATAALAASPTNAGGRTSWAPAGGGLSADGQHGFTYGFMTIRPVGQPERPAKYLAYWIKRPAGWRVAAFKRFGWPPGEPTTPLPAPSLPARLAAPPGDAAGHRASVMVAEQAFSDEAQVIGLGPAFAKHGRADAVNMGGGPGFTVGAANIGREIGSGPARRVVWSADDALAAASGDLGVTWGRIRPVGAAPEGAPAEIPFFTIWRRDSPAAPWRYIAE